MNTAPVQILQARQPEQKAQAKSALRPESGNSGFEKLLRKAAGRRDDESRKAEKPETGIEKEKYKAKREESEKNPAASERISEKGSRDGIPAERQTEAGERRKRGGKKRRAEDEGIEAQLSIPAGSRKAAEAAETAKGHGGGVSAGKTGLKAEGGKLKAEKAPSGSSLSCLKGGAAEHAAVSEASVLNTGEAGKSTKEKQTRKNDSSGDGKTAGKVLSDGVRGERAGVPSAMDAEKLPSRLKAAGEKSQGKAGDAAEGLSGKKSGRGKLDGIKVADRRSSAGKASDAFADAVKDAFQTRTESAAADSADGKAVIEVNLPEGGETRFQPQNRTVQANSLMQQLKESINSEIVKQAGIVVKDNGTGEIKLVLKPESLGKVRIQLSLNDNHIAGRIIVENNMVREIFESNLQNLYKAFGSGGFESGGLEVSVQGDGSGSAGGRRQHPSGRKVIEVMEDMVPAAGENEWRDSLVNLVV